jgi:hypothetical protein
MCGTTLFYVGHRIDDDMCEVLVDEAVDDLPAVPVTTDDPG